MRELRAQSYFGCTLVILQYCSGNFGVRSFYTAMNLASRVLVNPRWVVARSAYSNVDECTSGSKIVNLDGAYLPLRLVAWVIMIESDRAILV